ncbi:hypothetical protein PAMP_016628 [Pampus punctatissimus]
MKVHECLQRYLRNSPAPALNYASGLSFQLLIDIRALPDCSEEAKELYQLLRQPHLQALLSAHDTVAQKDYEPVLPPMPDDVPDDEEATRIVCLVKNKQPLLHNHQRVGLPLLSASPPCAKKRSRAGVRSQWDTLKRLTWQQLHRGSAFGLEAAAAGSDSLDVKDSSCHVTCSVRRGSYPQTDPPCRPVARPCPPPRYKMMSNTQTCCSKPMSQCRVCYTNLLWEQSLNRSAPSVYSSVLIDNITEDLNSEDEDEAPSPFPIHTPNASQRWMMSPPYLTVPYYSSVGDYLQPGLPPRLRNQSLRIRTAPPSPMQPRHVLEIPQTPPVELAKQESLDELRTTVQLAASSMESNTKDIKLLGEKMAAATERMSETVQDNSQALVLLTQVVDRLQMLLTTSRTEIHTPAATAKPADTEQDGTPKRSQTPKSRRQHPSLMHQSTCSLPSLSSSTSSSSSLSICLNVPSNSEGSSRLSVSCRGSPRANLKNKSTASPQKKHFNTELQASKHPLTNGLLEEPKQAAGAVKGGRSKQRKKRKKKKTK